MISDFTLTRIPMTAVLLRVIMKYTMNMTPPFRIMLNGTVLSTNIT